MIRRMVNIKEAARASGLSEWELKRGVHAGDYPYIRVGEGRGKFLFDIELLNETIKNRALMNMSQSTESKNILPFGIRKVN